MNKHEDHSYSRVPYECRLPLLGIMLVHAGMLTALDQFMLGAILGHSMSMQEAFIAIIIASLVFGTVTFALGYAGMKEGLTGVLLARWSGFGRVGSVLISVIVAISLLGWFGIQNSLFAKGIDHALNGMFGFELSAALSGLFLTFLVAFGIKAIKIAASIAVPIFIVVITFISIPILSHLKMDILFNTTPQGETLTIANAITIIVGGCIVAALMTPDITRYAKKTSHVLSMTLFTVLVGEFIINGLAIMLARALNTENVVIIMAQTTGGIGLLAVIFSTLRVNDLNLYSSSLSIANAIEITFGKKLSYTSITIIIGIIGTTLSVLGILDRFINFLTLLGIIFPPIVGVMIVGYFCVKKNTRTLNQLRDTNTLPGGDITPLIGWEAIFSCALGSLIGAIDKWGVPAINSLLVASISYWCMYKFKYFTGKVSNN
ncbi:cytosine permease [Symbiopectobacterium purcellii]|uniref:cytosine permease n=1 Tax=Symbiopectobacterium purcellii TaxID=2871826 RepID=UPI003F867A49